MAAPIRQHMHANVTHDGQRIFIFRQVNGWTNISLDSTDTSPKLTCDPITVLNLIVGITLESYTRVVAIAPTNYKLMKGSLTLLYYSRFGDVAGQADSVGGDGTSADEHGSGRPPMIIRLPCTGCGRAQHSVGSNSGPEHTRSLLC